MINDELRLGPDPFAADSSDAAGQSAGNHKRPSEGDGEPEQPKKRIRVTLKYPPFNDHGDEIRIVPKSTKLTDDLDKMFELGNVCLDQARELKAGIVSQQSLLERQGKALAKTTAQHDEIVACKARIAELEKRKSEIEAGSMKTTNCTKKLEDNLKSARAHYGDKVSKTVDLRRKAEWKMEKQKVQNYHLKLEFDRLFKLNSFLDDL